MKRQFEIRRVIQLEYATPFEGELLLHQIMKSQWIEPDVCGEYATVHHVEIEEITLADDIARSVGEEVAELLGQTVFVNPIGDNGSDDRGYEIVDVSGKRCIADIGVVFRNGGWDVVRTIGMKDIPVDDVEDLVTER